jgi:hypothetical protein
MSGFIAKAAFICDVAAYDEEIELIAVAPSIAKF